MSMYMYDAANSPDLATCKRHGAIAMSHYLTGNYAGSSPQPKATRALGMGPVMNWERDPGALVNATRAEGQAIGREAMAAIDKDCPRDGSVGAYFSVDLSVARAKITSCDAGFQGLNDVCRGKFKVKVYGEGALIDHLVSKGLVQSKQWLSMSESFPGFNAASKNVCVVQMHDAHGNWIGTDVGGTDRNTITDPHALDAWWPVGSPYATTTSLLEAIMSDATDRAALVKEIAAAVWAQPVRATGGATHAAGTWLIWAQQGASSAATALISPSGVLARVAALQKSTAAQAQAAAIDAHAVAVAIRDQLVSLLGGTK